MIKTIRVKEGEIPYILTRKNVKNINFRIKPDGVVYISANRRVPEKYIRELIAQNGESFLNTIREINAKSKSQKEAGDSFYFLGRRYETEIIPSAENVCLLKDKLYVYTNFPEKSEELIGAFTQSETKRLYREAVEKIYNMVKADGTPFPTKISIKKMTSRWGSCTPSNGHMSLNSELIKYPLGCLYYVVLHEFTHFHYRAGSRQKLLCLC
ncbi:MAG: M48 family metallopeptidase [Clostridiales bacterium]|nr:M48 family metallopeptidase [Clostridiales bacterium]